MHEILEDVEVEVETGVEGVVGAVPISVGDDQKGRQSIKFV